MSHKKFRVNTYLQLKQSIISFSMSSFIFRGIVLRPNILIIGIPISILSRHQMRQFFLLFYINIFKTIIISFQPWAAPFINIESIICMKVFNKASKCHITIWILNRVNSTWKIFLRINCLINNNLWSFVKI